MGELTRSISSGIPFEESEDLVVRLKENDEEAFAEVFHLYKDMVYRLSYRLLADKAEAMDITQEVFLVLFRKIASFRGDCSLKTWLYRVCFNQAANRNRWWKRRFKNHTLSLNIDANGNEPNLPESASRMPSPEQDLYSQELQKVLHESLKNLPFEQRAAVTLRDVEGLSYEEIAKITGTNVGTVKSRIARGREQLRQLLLSHREGSL
ncbi:MAG TPA: sigma-70 family RNA polymerase sigma factor [Acidobacteriota bacterium]|nr:sigma-70 family RNA polymerase sigma factor [Acidobacteriota bacterium]